MIPQLTEHSLWSKLVEIGECWEWTGPRDPKGYGKTKYAGRHVRVHRLAFELATGPIPDAAMVLHKCDNRPCARPDHLFLGDAQTNVDDMIAKGRINLDRDHRMLTAGGLTLPIAEWARRTGLARGAIHCRLRRGWSEEDAVRVPPQKNGEARARERAL